MVFGNMQALLIFDQAVINKKANLPTHDVWRARKLS